MRNIKPKITVIETENKYGDLHYDFKYNGEDWFEELDPEYESTMGGGGLSMLKNLAEKGIVEVEHIKKNENENEDETNQCS